MTSLLASHDTHRPLGSNPDHGGLDVVDELDLRDVAVAIDLDGVARLDHAVVDRVLTLATAASASPVLAEVFGDDTEPAPVRERAFGKLAMQIVAGAPRFTLAA